MFNFYTQDGYKEREDRIAELEEFINDQVAELDKMEVAMKQTVANKRILEKDYQKLHEHYNSAKVCSIIYYHYLKHCTFDGNFFSKFSTNSVLFAKDFLPIISEIM